MNKKCVIKNCPAFCDVDDDWDCISRDTEELKCQDCTDCILKKIVELCKEPNEPYYNPKCEFGKGRTDLAEEILELLEIEECKE